MEKKSVAPSGFFNVIVQLILIGYSTYSIYSNWETSDQFSTWIKPSISMAIALILFNAYVVLQPNESAILSFLGTYKGTITNTGFLLKNPFYGHTVWSLRVSNYATEILKVNDKKGVPIEVAATIVWKVGDTYKAHYDVEDLNEYIDNQFEISLRTLAKSHTYMELSTEEKDFIADLTDKASKAGVIVLDAKITHLNYAPEIAASMLQKQQAGAMSEAKEIIVENAVAIAQTAAREITEMTNEQKGKFISDLIIVLCSERAVSPVVTV